MQMNSFIKIKQGALLLGDLLLLYLSLLATLAIRYQSFPNQKLWSEHFWPFTGIFGVWIITNYIAELYNIHLLKNSFEFNKKWGVVLIVNFTLAMAIFYFLPNDSGLTPKTNLILLTLIFGIVGFIWRRYYNIFLHKGEQENKMLLVGDGPIAQDIISHIKVNPQLGYHLKAWLKGGLDDADFQNLSEIIKRESINVIVVPAHIKKNSLAAKKIYQNLILGIEVMDLATLYGLILQKIPLTELEEVWFLENLTRKHKIYESAKRPLEIVLSVFSFLIFLIPSLIIAIFIKMTSRGNIFLKQIRIGRNEKPFTIYKFRSMTADAEKSGPRWATTNDPRVTAIGKFLRFSHLDEIPQLVNIFKGDLSFVGPRPERPEFVEKLKKEIPYYDLRHLVRPGLTGWAQLNYRYGSTTEDAYQKLQYDIYYLKNYSFWLDLSILIKTVKLFFIKAK